jgi:hypothetical protein
MAFFFNGTTHFLELIEAPVTAAPLTMVYWFKNFGKATQNALGGISDSVGTEKFVIEARGDVAQDPIRARTFSVAVGNNASTSPSGFHPQKWAHGGGAYAAANSRIAYLNGVAGAAQTTSMTPLLVTQTNIGCTRGSSANTLFYYGSIAEFAIWSVALSAGEMAFLASGACPLLVRPASLVLYCPLLVDFRNTKGTSFTSSAPPTFTRDHPNIFSGSAPRIVRRGDLLPATLARSLYPRNKVGVAAAPSSFNPEFMMLLTPP